MDKNIWNDYITMNKKLKDLYDFVIINHAKKYNLNSTEAMLLLFLITNPNLNTSKIAAEQLGFSKSLISNCVESLSKRDIISFYENENDRRLKFIKLNKEGKNMANALRRAKESFIESVTSIFEEEDKERINDYIAKINKFIRNY